MQPYYFARRGGERPGRAPYDEEVLPLFLGPILGQYFAFETLSDKGDRVELRDVRPRRHFGPFKPGQYLHELFVYPDGMVVRYLPRFLNMPPPFTLYTGPFEVDEVEEIRDTEERSVSLPFRLDLVARSGPLPT